MVISEITLFNTLKAKLGEQEAQTIVEGIKQTVKEEFDNKKDILATKQDIHEIKVEIEKLWEDLERGLRTNLQWIVGTIIASAGIIITLIKLL